MNLLAMMQKVSLAEWNAAESRLAGQCEYQMAWAAERKVNPRCSFKATTEIEGKKLCTFHAKRITEGTGGNP